MDQPIELTLEQEFSLRGFADQVQQMSREQAQEFLLLQHKHMMIREKKYQEILKKYWELDRKDSGLPEALSGFARSLLKSLFLNKRLKKPNSWGLLRMRFLDHYPENHY